MVSRVLKISLKEENYRLSVKLEDGAAGASVMDVVHSTILQGVELPSGESNTLICKYRDDEGDLCTLRASTVADWLSLFPDGPLRLQVDLVANVGCEGGARNTRDLRATLPKEAPASSKHQACSQNVQKAPVQPEPAAVAAVQVDVVRLSKMMDHSDEKLRRGAVDKLAGLCAGGSSAALAALAPLTSINDEYVRRTAVDAVCVAVDSENKDAPALLLSAITSSDEYVRRQAAAALRTAAASGHPDAHRAVSMMMASDDEHLRHAAAAMSGNPGVVQLETRASASSDSSKRPREDDELSLAVQELTERIAKLRLDALGGDSTAISRLLDLAEERTERVRRSAVDAAAEASASGIHSSVRSWATLAKHDDEWIRRRATSVLSAAARQGCDGAAPALMSLTASGDECVRRTAAEALCACCAANTCDNGVLELLAAHDDEAVRKLVAVHLFR